jgi:SSS family solute:Na+ symporter
MELAVLDVVVFLVFVTAVISFGLLKSRHEGDSESYFLAGRGLSWWLIGFSLIAANISAEQFVGMSGQAAKDHVGLAIASYEWIAAATLVVVAFFFLPKFLRSGIYTIPEYLEYRYSQGARAIMSLLMVVTLVCVNITTVIFLGAKALEPLFAGHTLLRLELNVETLAWIVGVAAAAYVAAGGLKACAWTDLFWGSSLIVGGAVVMALTFMALDRPDDFQGLDAAAVAQNLGVEPDATLGEKFAVLKQKKMHMVLPADNPAIPWTALIVGIWIPNFYYWGLNQYIMQRTLGARSLADGQRGVVFAAALKLIIPFIVCIPGVIAFALFHGKMQESAMQSARLNAKALEEFERVKSAPAHAAVVFPFNGDFADLHPDKAREILVFNAAVAGFDVPPDADLDALRTRLVPALLREHPEFQDKLDAIDEHNKSLDAGEQKKTLGVGDLNGAAIALATGEHRPVWRQWLQWLSGDAPEVKKKQELIGYDHDGAFPLLIRYLTPTGLRGFVLAALMGAVVSSLAAMLNAASTIFTMDVYKEFLNKKASQATLVFVGRCCVPVAVLVGCLIAPRLAKPEFQGAFHFIQEFQGYISPGILTVFLFGLFVPKSPRVCGVIGLLLCPVVYGALHLFAPGVAFLNRMAITVGALAAVLAILTFAKPLAEPVVLPTQTRIDMTSSSGAKLFGVIVVAATVALYVVFW